MSPNPDAPLEIAKKAAREKALEEGCLEAVAEQCAEEVCDNPTARDLWEALRPRGAEAIKGAAKSLASRWIDKNRFKTAYQAAHRRSGSRQDSEDAAQETLRKFHGLTEPEQASLKAQPAKLFNWLRRVADCQVVDGYRHTKKLVPVEQVERPDVDLAADEALVAREEENEHQARRLALSAAIDRLPPDLLKVVRLRLQQGPEMTFQEIGAALDLSLQKAYRLYRAALSLLRQSLTRINPNPKE